MNFLKYIIADLVETLLRVLPTPGKTGLVRIGNPGRNAPVFLTGNYHLTVEKVKRALRGLDAYLLIANSRGVNVWCAATGGHLTHHDVISVLKTSGIEAHVDHRRVILPQLAAPGVEGKIVRKKTDWKVIWGPAYAEDIPAFLGNELKKTQAMRKVKFPWKQRVEMSVAWAFPISVVSALITLPFWPDITLPLVGLIWGLAFLIFMSFPLYRRLLNSGGKRIGFIFFDFGRGGFQLVLWGAFMLGLVTYAFIAGDLSWGFTFRWAFMSFVVILTLSLDLMGSTPLYKSGLHEDKLLEVALDENKCKGAGFCEQVCPKNCFDVDKTLHLATMPRAHECVQCGACIVQCSFDALYFKSPRNEIIPPETTRKFKLNIMGKRLIKV